MSNDNPIYIKLEYNEALQSKKDILSSEIDLLDIIKIIKKYHLFKSQELKIKLNLYKKLKEFRINLGKIQQTLPKIKNLETDDQKEEIAAGIEHKIYDPSLESQLQEIQNKLRDLE